MKTDFISREAAMQVLCDACGNAACPKGLIPKCSYGEQMQAIPAADVISLEYCNKCGAKTRETIERLQDIIAKHPAADVRPGVDAEWIDNGNETVSCSRCQTWFPKERLPYMRICGYCGADMRKVVEIDLVKEGAE